MTDEFDYWESLVADAEDAEDGDKDATQIIFHDLALFLEGKAIQFRGVYQSAEVRRFLAKRLHSAIGINMNDVGRALGLGIGAPKSRRSKHHKHRSDFVTWYRKTQEEQKASPTHKLTLDEKKKWMTSSRSDISGNVVDRSDIAERTVDNWEKQYLSIQKQEDVSHLFSPID